ncbi:WD40-repeat-containing domain protein [Xylogone sp. PMI_703]|nr:WD40-repeat-containing domain protein [Xylogone sp. PMI_703]
MSAKSDIDHWQINALVYHDRVEEIHYITDPARNIRRKPHTKVWKTERFLGRGGFGEVRLEKNVEDNKVRAVKKIPIISSALSNDECGKELEALLQFSKPKSKEAAVFVDFFGWFKDSFNVFLAMEYIPLGDLETNVKAHSGRIPEVEARDIIEQILSGLEIMHAESFAHRDLKPQNVLVVHGSPEWWVKLADFGLSKRLTEITAFRTKSGTQSYMAPELLDYLDIPREEYTNAVDVWAVGCITYRLVTGIVPFPPGRSLFEYCKDKSLFPYDALLDHGVKSVCVKFIKELLQTSPEQRPSSSQALDHTWINSGSNAKKQSQNPNQTAKINELPDSTMAYNTSTNIGLKSKAILSAGQSHSPHMEFISSTSPITNGNISTSFDQREDLGMPPSISDSELTKQAPVSNETSRSLVESDILEGTLSTKTSLPMLQVVSENSNGITDSTSTALPPDTPPITSKSQDKTAMTFSPDGKIVALLSNNRITRLWDTTSCDILQTLEHTVAVRCIALSPDGKTVASGSDDKTVRLWNTTTGVATLTGHTLWIWSVAFSPYGKIVASASSDRTVRLWDITIGVAIKSLEGHTKPVLCVAFSPDGRIVASGSKDKTIRLWDTTTGNILQTLEGHTEVIRCVTFSADSKIIASGSYDRTVRLWSTITGATLQVLEGHTKIVWCVAFSPDGKIVASASEDRTIRLWNTTTGDILHTFKEHTTWSLAIYFSSAGKIIVSASRDGAISLWDVATVARSLQD